MLSAKSIPSGMQGSFVGGLDQKVASCAGCTVGDIPHSMTNFAQAMPDKYKVKDNAVQAYRNYYNGEKGYFAKWYDGKTPDWWDPVQNLMTV